MLSRPQPHHTAQNGADLRLILTLLPVFLEVGRWIILISITLPRSWSTNASPWPRCGISRSTNKSSLKHIETLLKTLKMDEKGWKGPFYWFYIILPPDVRELSSWHLSCSSFRGAVATAISSPGCQRLEHHWLVHGSCLSKSCGCWAGSFAPTGRRPHPIIDIWRA